MMTAPLLVALCLAQTGGSPAPAVPPAATAKPARPDPEDPEAKPVPGGADADEPQAKPVKPAAVETKRSTTFRPDLEDPDMKAGISTAPVKPAVPTSDAAKPVLDAADGTARIGRAIIARDIETLVALTPAPFSFDGVLARSSAEVRQRWAETLDRHPVERLRLFGVEVLTYPAMVEKYGQPPARLSSVSLKDAKLGIANLSGRATIVAWKHRGDRLAAVAISD